MQINDIMTHGVEAVPPDCSIREAAVKMRDQDIGSLAVSDRGDLIGVITDRDICCDVVAEDLDPESTTVREVMSSEVSYCFADQEVDEAAELMESNRIRRLVILNRDKTMAGFLSVDDLARWSPGLAGEVIEAASPAH